MKIIERLTKKEIPKEFQKNLAKSIAAILALFILLIILSFKMGIAFQKTKAIIHIHKVELKQKYEDGKIYIENFLLLEPLNTERFSWEEYGYKTGSYYILGMESQDITSYTLYEDKYGIIKKGEKNGN